MDDRASGEIKTRKPAAQRGIQQTALAPDHVRHRAYTISDQSTMNSAMALNFILSAKAPVMRAPA